MPHALSFFLPSVQGMDKEKNEPRQETTAQSALRWFSHAMHNFLLAAPNFAWKSKNKIKIVVHVNKSP
jgi:coenzyme F420-reducing hydrogenase alpha subunit